MPQPNDGILTMEEAQIIFRNFAGKEGKYNREGDRNFCVLLGDDIVPALRQDGWNIKELRAREEGDTPQAYVQVSVSYRVKPPRIMLVTPSTNTRTPLDETMIELLDWIDIKHVDLTINPYRWAVRDDTGVKAYLKTMYVVINEDPLDQKYADLEELPARGGRTIEAAPQQMELDAAPERVVLEGEWK